MATLAGPVAMAGATAPASGADDVDVLVLGGAGSPVLSELREGPGVDAVSTSEATTTDPDRYDALILDGDRVPTDRLDDHRVIERFVAAGDWVLAFDALTRDRAELEEHTGVTVNEDGPERSETYAFRVSSVGGGPTAQVLDSGQVTPLGADEIGDGRQGELRRYQSRRLARILLGEIRDAGAAADDAPRTGSSARGATLRKEPAELKHYRVEYTAPQDVKALGVVPIHVRQS